MSLVSILSNPAAMTVQSNLGKSQGIMEKVIGHITSGVAVDSAAASPAAFAIATKIKSTIGVLEQVSRNAAQAISVANVAAGGYTQLNNILSKMKNLAAQVINPALGPNEKAFAQQEFAKLLEQVDKTANDTKFNGVALLKGNGGTVTSFGAVNAAVTGSTACGSFTGNLTATMSQGYIGGVVKDATVTDTGVANQYKFTITLESSGGVQQTFSAVSATPAAGNVVFRSESSDLNILTLETDAAIGANASAIQSEMRTAFGIANGTYATIAMESTAFNGGVTSINSAMGVAAGDFVLRSNTDGNVSLIESSGRAYTIANVANGAQTLSFSNGLTVDLNGTFVQTTAITPIAFHVSAGSDSTLTFQIGETSSDTLDIDVATATASALGLSGLEISTVTTAQTALTTLTDAITNVTAALATLGAEQSQLSFVSSNLETIIENLTTALGSFQDADIAKEMTQFTKQQVLQQAGIAMLVQANQIPQSLLRLIQS